MTPAKRQPVPFGKYLLLDRINIGGMAEVWRAKTFGAGGFERIVAIKRILPNIAEDEEFIGMFIDEAKITVQLNHSSIAQVYELANLSNSYFIAMEYVSGKDMRAVFDRCRKRGEAAPIPLICYLIAQCADGLDYAHRAKDKQGRDMGIVHRDVSPQNVLISYDGEVKVIDFGIAKAAGKATKTQAGILKGKFGYMSPEQIRGLPLDGRSDVFALGVCLYEMLTCERLFVGDSDFSVLEKVRKVEVLPPSHFNRKIPEPLERIVMKALAKDVDDRYASGADLAEALRTFMYSSGNAFTRKDLALFVKATFAEDYDKEKARLLEYTEVKAPDSLPRGPEASPTSAVSIGAVPNPGVPSPSAITAGPPVLPEGTNVLLNAPPAGARKSSPSGLVPSRGPPSMPRLTAAAPMLTNGKAEHDSTILADPGLPPFEDPSTTPELPSRSTQLRNAPPAAPAPSDITTDPVKQLSPRPPISAPETTPPLLEPDAARRPAVPPPQWLEESPLSGPTILTKPTRFGVQANDNTLIVALAGIVALLVLGIIGVVVFKPGPTGLVMVTVPDDAKATATLNINGKEVTDEKGNRVRDWPQIWPVPVGKATITVRADGYQPVIEVLDVREGNVPVSMTKELKQKTTPP